MLQRRVGQHQAEMPQPRSHFIGQLPARRPWTALQEHDGPLGGLEQIGLGIRDDAETARRLEAVHHHRQRLCLARLPAPQLAHHPGRRRVAGEMVAPEPLEGDDLARPQRRDHLLERVGHVAHPAARVPQGKSRPTGRTGGRLRVEPAIPGVLILLTTAGTHGERGHRGPLAVIRQRPDDREARTALGAVQERISVAPIPAIAHLREASPADRQVRRGKQRQVSLAGTGVDPESLTAMMRRGPVDGDAPKMGRGRGGGLQPVQEPSDGLVVALGVDQDAVRPVANRPTEPMGFREPVDKGAKPDALDNPFNQDATAGPVSRRRQCSRRAHVTPSDHVDAT